MANLNNEFTLNGALGGMVAGQQFADERDNQAMRLMQLFLQNEGSDLANQKTIATQPNEILKSMVEGRTAQTRLNTPAWFQSGVEGDMAKNRSLVTAADESAFDFGQKKELAPFKLKAEQAKAAMQLSDTQISHMQSVAELGRAMASAGAFDAIPDAARGAFVRQMAQRYGLNADEDPILSGIVNLPGQQIPQAFGEVTTALGNTLKFRQDMMKQREHDDALYNRSVDTAATRVTPPRAPNFQTQVLDLIKQEVLGAAYGQREPTPQEAAQISKLAAERIVGYQGGKLETPERAGDREGEKAKGAIKGVVEAVDEIQAKAAAMKEWNSYDPNMYEYGKKDGKIVRRLRKAKDAK